MKNNKHTNYLTILFEDNISTILILFIVTFIIFSIINPSFAKINNLQSMAFQFSELGLFSIAMSIAIIPGGIDLSIVAIANLSSIFMAIFIKNILNSYFIFNNIYCIIFFAIFIGLLVGIICGFINGLLIGYLEIPAILATLVTMTIYNGLSIGITKGTTLASMPKELTNMINYSIFYIPIPLLVFLLVGLIVHIVLMMNKLGWNIFLIGTNLKASILTGIKTRKSILISHIIIGIIASISGIVILGRTNSASAQYGNSYILTSILVVILGGINILGGKGIFIGVIISVVFLQTLSTGFNFILQGISGSNFFKDFVWGLLLIIMIFINKNGYFQTWFKGLFNFNNNDKIKN